MEQYCIQDKEDESTLIVNYRGLPNIDAWCLSIYNIFIQKVACNSISPLPGNSKISLVICINASTQV